ncbi:MAG: ECF transporter S component [Firmicutes bacterium]|nr:ECF transporter S component [Bacillota bacterium]
MSETERLRVLVLTALFIALVTVATMLINVPTIATKGFINVGDTVVFLSALLMGPRVGLLAGGLGSALADLLLGYVHWAPWTLIIKGAEGLIAASLGYHVYRREKRIGPKVIVALAVAAIWMVLGYYIAGGIMTGFKPALASVPGNLLQGFGSALIAVPLLHAFRNLQL